MLERALERQLTRKTFSRQKKKMFDRKCLKEYTLYLIDVGMNATSTFRSSINVIKLCNHSEFVSFLV
jgi:hypothetical protein